MIISENSERFLIIAALSSRAVVVRTHLLFVADAELLAAFGAAACQDDSAIFGGHSRAEAVFVDPFPFAGLKGRLHA